jgi:hypothetical protein
MPNLSISSGPFMNADEAQRYLVSIRRHCSDWQDQGASLLTESASYGDSRLATCGQM